MRHSGANLKFHTLNDRCLYRADSLFDKEPETIEWIDGFREASVFWDVGACIGTYAVYAGVTKIAQVISVENSRNTAVANRCAELLKEHGFEIQKIGRANTIWQRANAVTLPA